MCAASPTTVCALAESEPGPERESRIPGYLPARPAIGVAQQSQIAQSRNPPVRSNPFVSCAPQFSLFQRAILTKSRVVIMPDESRPTGDFQPLVGGRVYPNHDGWQQFLQTPRRLPQASATTTPAMHSRSHSCSKHSLILPQEYQPNRQLRPRFMANISPFVGPSAICDLRELLHRQTTNSKNRPRPTQHPLLTTPVLRKVDAETT